MGALVITQRQPPQYIGQQRMVVATGTGSSTYATGGETTSARALGLARLDRLEVQPVGAATTTFMPRWNGSRTAPTVQFFGGAAGAFTEAAAATNVTTYPVRIVAYGI